MNLCCGNSLQGGVKAIGLSDIIVEIGTLAINIYSMVPHIETLNCIRNKSECHEHVNDRLTEIGVVTLDATSSLIHLVELLLVIVVYKGAQERSHPKCQIWVRITEVLTSLDGIIFIWHMILEWNIVTLAFMIPNLIYKIYCCGVVESFLKEMRSYTGIPAPPGPYD